MKKKKGGFSIRDAAQHRETRGWIESKEMERIVLTAREKKVRWHRI